MPADPAGAFSPIDASGAVRSIERLVAQKRFEEAANMAGRSLRFEPGRRDVALLHVRALVGARRYGEAADRALALLETDPRDMAARTILRTAVGRLHRSVRAVLTGAPADSTPHVLAPVPSSEEADTARHEPFGPFDERAFAAAREGGTGVRFASGRITSEMPSDEPSVETTADEEPLL